MKNKLTLKEEMFCRESVATLNPTEAVRRVYKLGSRGGTSMDTARSMASENLTKPHIKARIDELIDKVTTDLRIDKNSRLLKLADIFWNAGVRGAIEANKEIAKMLGDYMPSQQEIKDFREDREKLVKPE